MVWDNFPNGPEHNVANYGDCCEPFFTSMEIGISIHKTLNYFPYCGQVVCMCLVHLFHPSIEHPLCSDWTPQRRHQVLFIFLEEGGGVSEKVIKSKGHSRKNNAETHETLCTKPQNDEKQNTKSVHDAGYSRNASCALNQISTFLLLYINA